MVEMLKIFIICTGAEHVGYTGETRNAYKKLAERPHWINEL
jgi:hypothetical protein